MGRRLIPEELPEDYGLEATEEGQGRREVAGTSRSSGSQRVDPMESASGVHQDALLHPVSGLFTSGVSPDSIDSTTDALTNDDDMRLAAYLRVSTEKQAEDDKYGLDRQRHDVEIFLARTRNEHELVLEVVDVTSGTNGVEGRDAFPDTLGRLEDGEIDGLVIADLTRLSRSLTTQEALLAAVWARGGRVFTADGFEVPQDDPDDPMRTAMRQMAGVFAQLERSMIAKRLRDGRKAKARKMREHHGTEYAWTFAPFGFRKTEEGTLIPDDGSDARRVVERISRLRREGLTLRDIATILNEEDVAAPRGGGWTATQVTRVLQRELRLAEGA